MATTDDTRQRGAARVCPLDARSRELHDQAGQCDAVLEEPLEFAVAVGPTQVVVLTSLAERERGGCVRWKPSRLELCHAAS